MTQRVVAAFAFVLLIAGCGTQESDPERAVRELIERALTAAEQRDSTTLKEMVAQDYRDGRGLDQRRVTALVHAYLLRHQRIHLYARVPRVEVIEPNQVRAGVVVAMAGAPISDAQALFGLRADIMRFDVWFRRRDGEWRVVRADWERAEVADLL